MPPRSPAEIARQTLQLLASRRLQPTPENYQAAYEEVANLLPREAFPQRRLRHIATLLPSQTPRQAQLTQAFAQAVEAKDWLQLQTAIVEYAQLELTSQPHITALPSAPQVLDTLSPGLAEALARLIENTVAVLGAEDARTREISLQLVDFLRQSAPDAYALEQMLTNYSLRMSFIGQEQAQRTHNIQQLLHMTIEHLCQLGAQDPPLLAQADKLREAMAPAWTSTQLGHIQHHLKSLLFRHLELHTSTQEAHERIKDLLAQYAHHMAELSTHSEQHQHQLEDCATHIEQAQHLGELAQLFEAVVASGNRLARDSHHAVAALQDLREQAQAQEAQIHQLSAHLQRMQDTSRHDASTGALNTQGLQEALLAETQRSQQLGTALSVGVLQMELPAQTVQDLGPDGNDLALRHLTQIARNLLRPQDEVGRTTDQHLVLLLPACSASQASQQLARMQQELALRPLLHGDVMACIGLSAGLVEQQPREAAQHTLERAARALRQALRMGGHKVVLG